MWQASAHIQAVESRLPMVAYKELEAPPPVLEAARAIKRNMGAVNWI
jgi:hypothetical protein